MPKVTVYLPEKLYGEARRRDLPLSSLLQRAIQDAIRRAGATDWATEAGARRRRVSRPVDTSALLEQVRDEFGG